MSEKYGFLTQGHELWSNAVSLGIDNSPLFFHQREMPLSFDARACASWSQGLWENGLPGASIIGFGSDTRALSLQQCFVALRTQKADGHDFLQAAKQAGATCALVERFIADVDLPQLVVRNSLAALQVIAREHRRTFSGPVIGITGSCGKTSTKQALGMLLGERALTTFKNLNNTLGVPLTLTQLDPKYHTCAVIEAGMNQVGEMAQCADVIQPDWALITCIGHCHTGPVGGIEAVAREKGVLAAPAKKGILLTSETLAYAAFADLIGKKAIWALCTTAAQLQALPNAVRGILAQTKRGQDRQQITLICEDFSCEHSFNIPILSVGQTSNLALALSCALFLGENARDLQERLPRVTATEHRGELYCDDQDRLWYADCYNANPLSMADALDYFSHYVSTGRPRTYVLGSMGELGDQAVAWHKKIAASLHLNDDDRALFIGTHAGDYLSAMKRPELARAFASTQEALRSIARTESGRIVFLKGSKPWKLWEVLPPEARLISKNEASVKKLALRAASGNLTS